MALCGSGWSGGQVWQTQLTNVQEDRFQHVLEGLSALPNMHLAAWEASLGRAVSLGARHRFGSPFSKRNLLCSGTYCAGCLLGNALGNTLEEGKEAGLIGQREADLQHGPNHRLSQPPDGVVWVKIIRQSCPKLGQKDWAFQLLLTSGSECRLHETVTVLGERTSLKGGQTSLKGGQLKSVLTQSKKLGYKPFLSSLFFYLFFLLLFNY